MNLDKLKTTDGIDVAGKRVIVRADLNVPIKNGKVTDATRLERVVPGLKALSDRGAKVIVISHFGRPKGVDPELSLRPVAQTLQDLLGRPVKFGEDSIGAAAEAAVQSLSNGDIAVLENLRFHKGEEKNDPEFASALAKLGDVFVGDAFSCSHRAHASTEGITHHLPSYAGPLLMEEINALRTALEKPQRPTAALVGGAKVSTKIPVLTNLVAKVDKLIIGGGMANTFLQAAGTNVGKSLAEPEFAETAREILAKAKEKGCEIVLPVDAVIAREFKEGAASEVVAIDDVPADAMILDVGPKSVAHVTDVLAGTKTLLWNGPMGAFEISPFGDGTFAVARAAASLTKAGKLVSVAGGGDTVAALNAANVTDEFTYVSTAGGAFLEWLEGRELPGIAALAR
ncbi:Phosphoglycerate kinase [Hyphomicrobium denitrificans ATCC 51888]|uniref:Phosphoglycerate kinase n=1 Tax=Hyphomicrobium denitrificans (strain ATCC 51888 / DSM 1869 / NCIMB 11706 / TK 0415) TaxID=582899 RepID=D8JYH8_HYPDA|nr:phosphoglycerate kinase [Hyphomicrobium denitrificans]ADJ23430.1 Phosphoglycerate kinase [Hyphomicrobium denitrificans ATCC 51888]